MLNIGLGAGLIHREMFAVLVVVALVTTAMTGPLLTALGEPRVRRPSADRPAPAAVVGGSSR